MTQNDENTILSFMKEQAKSADNTTYDKKMEDALKGVTSSFSKAALGIAENAVIVPEAKKALKPLIGVLQLAGAFYGAGSGITSLIKLSGAVDGLVRDTGSSQAAGVQATPTQP